MNPTELIRIANHNNLDSENQFKLRIKFGIACIERVEHLITDDQVFEALSVGKAFVVSKSDESELSKAASKAMRLASGHPGSNSIDGAGSAAVTTSRGVAAALAGKALQAAGYAAYASVYSYASYAVTDLSAYETEHGWQIRKLKEIVQEVSDK